MKNLSRLFVPVIATVFCAGLMVSADTIRTAVPRTEAPAPPPIPSINAYPNPFIEVLNVSVAGASNKPVIMRLRSVPSGVIVLEYTVTYNGPVALNTSSIPAGNYLLSVSSPNGYLIGRREVRKAS